MLDSTHSRELERQKPREPSDVSTPKKLAGKEHEILHAAVSLFAEKGFKATTLKDVSVASQANSALVSYYFGNKEGLIKAVIQYQLEKAQTLTEPFFADAQGTTPSIANLRQLVASILNFHLSDSSFFRTQLWVLTEGGDLRVSFAQELWAPIFKKFCWYLRRITPSLSESEVESRCLLLFGMIDQYSKLLWCQIEGMEPNSSPETLLKQYQATLTGPILDTLCQEKY